MKLDGCGRVLLFRGTGFGSGFIEWATHSPVSHAALLYADGVTIIESIQFAGVRKRQLQAGEWRRIECYQVAGMTPRMWEKCLFNAEREIGCGYDWDSLFCWILRLPRKLAHLTKWFCSELAEDQVAGRGFNNFDGVELVARKPAWEVTPADLQESEMLILDPSSKLL